ncbi:MAG: DUF2017 family protein [Jatrophihabitantaceae bacterium]
MKISKDAEGVRVRMGSIEADTLSSLVADLANALQPGCLDAADPVYQRLFPDGYRDNPEAAAAFRVLTEDSLLTERRERAMRCLAELSEAATGAKKLDVHLGPDAAQRWIQVLNDMRLAVGTRLGVTEDHDGYGFDPKDPEAMSWSIYAYLTGVQDSVVRAL